jgi:hypothetical protein
MRARVCAMQLELDAGLQNDAKLFDQIEAPSRTKRISKKAQKTLSIS